MCAFAAWATTHHQSKCIKLLYKWAEHCYNPWYSGPASSGVASSISGGDIFIYSCSAQLNAFEIDSISKEINCTEHEYMNMSPSRSELATPLPASLMKVTQNNRGKMMLNTEQKVLKISLLPAVFFFSIIHWSKLLDKASFWIQWPNCEARIFIVKWYTKIDQNYCKSNRDV